MMVTLTNYVIARVGSTTREPLSIWKFCDTFLLNIGKGQNKVLPSKHGAPGTLPRGKSGPGYCITSIKN